MRVIQNNRKYLIACIAIALVLCVAQIMANSMLVTGCLALYMVLVCWCCSNSLTLPILLFFLPWSPLLRLNPNSYSFYTFGIVLICLISIVKKRFLFRNYQLKAGFLLLFLSLLSKLLDGSELAFDYIAFMMMVFLFPVVREESRKKKYDFYQLVIFLSLGVVIASLCAMEFADYANIRRFIRVDSYLTIVRRSGFYGDANFYTAHILAALGGALPLTLQETKRKKIVFLGINIFVLMYCGFLSGSKSFVLVSAMLLLMWVFSVLKMRGRGGLKIVLLACFLWGLVYIATSAMFSSLIDVLVARFATTRDLNSFTTGRIRLWNSYFNAIVSDVKVFFLGRGFTNIKINDRASHSTLIQIFYQFGLIGSPVLVYWIFSFYRNSRHKQKKHKPIEMGQLMVFVGVFVPWLAIDILFFDEFFLFQWFVLVALEQSFGLVNPEMVPRKTKFRLKR